MEHIRYPLTQRCRGGLAGLAAAGLSFAVAAPESHAQDQPTMAGARVESQSFQAVSGPPEEEVSGAALMLTGYTVAWVLMLLFVLRLGFLHRATERELSTVKHALQARVGERSIAQGDAEPEDQA